MKTITKPEDGSGKERLIRGPKLEVLVPGSRGFSFVDALRIAERGRRVIASNSRISKALVGSEEWKDIFDPSACIKTHDCGYLYSGFMWWTGTIIAHERAGKKLGAEIVSTNDPRWVFPVPEQFRGMKDVCLVVEHPDYTLEGDGNNLVVQARVVDLVENFPADDGWYLPDPKHGIPQGSRVHNDGPECTSFDMIDCSDMVCPIHRGGFWTENRSLHDRIISLHVDLSLGLEVAVEAP